MAKDSEPTINRRRLLQVVGGAGLAATLAACSGWRTTTAPSPTRSAAPTGPPMTTSPVPSASEPQTALAATAPPTEEPAPSPSPAATDESPAPPDPQPTTAMPAASSAVLLCRESWGARPPRAGGRAHTIERLTIHHTAAVLGDNRNITARLRQHQNFHMGEKGWIDIAYHVGVDRNGNIFELRAPELAGDTATSYDPTGHFLVVCEGHFDQEVVSEAQLNGAALAFAWAIQTFGVPSETLRGHRDWVPSTSCPGEDLHAHVASGGLRSRIDDVLARGPVDLEPICGDDAAAIVAAIETGK